MGDAWQEWRGVDCQYAGFLKPPFPDSSKRFLPGFARKSGGFHQERWGNYIKDKNCDFISRSVDVIVKNIDLISKMLDLSNARLEHQGIVGNQIFCRIVALRDLGGSISTVHFCSDPAMFYAEVYWGYLRARANSFQANFITGDWLVFFSTFGPDV